MATRPCTHGSRQRSACFGRAWHLAAMPRPRCQSRYSPVETSFMTRKFILILLAAAVALAATGLYARWFRHDTALQGSGTVESRNIRVGSKLGGRPAQRLHPVGLSLPPRPLLLPPPVTKLYTS